ncbi:MAG: spore maturation protein [bacterium]|nr:spore maturation protein [bacterium]
MSTLFQEVAPAVSQWMIPLLMLVIIVAGYVKKVPMYESFVTGAKEGFDVAVRIIPYLVAILLVVKVFMASGVFTDLKVGLAWVMTGIGMERYTPSLDLIPLALTMPLTGGGALGVLADTLERHGPDSFVGLSASIMMGSTETTFYVLTVYYGAVGIKKIRHTLPACLVANAAGIIAALILGWVLFG